MLYMCIGLNSPPDVVSSEYFYGRGIFFAILVYFTLDMDVFSIILELLLIFFQ